MNVINSGGNKMSEEPSYAVVESENVRKDGREV